MQDQASFYPVRVVSRSVARRHAKRTSWFVMGAGFGVGCALFLSSTLSSTSMPFSWSLANEAPTLSLSLVEKQVNELSTTKSIDVVAVALPPKGAIEPPAEAAALTPAIPSPVPMGPDVAASAISQPMPAVSDSNPAIEAQTEPSLIVAAPVAAPAMVAQQAVAPAPVMSASQPVALIGAKGEHEPAQALAQDIAPLAPAVAAPAAVAEQETASADAPRPSPDMYPMMLDLKVGHGDTLMNILTDTGVSYQEAHNAVASISSLYDPKKLDIGQNVSVTLSKGKDGEQPVISKLNVPVSNISSVLVTRQDSTDSAHFAAKEVKAQVYQKSARAGGKIENSLYETGMESGIPANVLAELINAYSYDVDFQRDIHTGDKIDVLFERMQTKEGTVASIGNVQYAELTLSGRPMRIFRYEDKAGNADYYNEKGESIRKAMLRTPINGAKITSAFGMRNHPILGYSKMHRGIDFGAPTGTPIYAAGDGVITFAGRKGGYGNYVSIQHDKKYGSAYGHISRFAAGMAPGKKVKQGQIIAYVGSTGMATGPHLHYEILVNNQQVNPSGVKFKTGNILGGKELASFKKNVTQIIAQLAQPKDKNVKVASK